MLNLCLFFLCHSGQHPEITHSKITPGSLGGQYGMLVTKPGMAICKANSLHTVPSLWPPRAQF